MDRLLGAKFSGPQWLQLECVFDACFSGPLRIFSDRVPYVRITRGTIHTRFLSHTHICHIICQWKLPYATVFKIEFCTDSCFPLVFVRCLCKMYFSQNVPSSTIECCTRFLAHLIHTRRICFIWNDQQQYSTPVSQVKSSAFRLRPN